MWCMRKGLLSCCFPTGRHTAVQLFYKCNTPRQIVPKLAFPHYNALPASLTILLFILSIPVNVFIKLILPEMAVRFRCGRFAIWASVPETAMHEYGQPPGWVADVWFTWRLGPVYSVTAQSFVPQRFTESEFGFGIFGFVAAHVTAYLFLGGKKWFGFRLSILLGSFSQLVYCFSQSGNTYNMA